MEGIVRWLFSVIGPLLAVYSYAKSQTTKQENRITMLEQEYVYFKESMAEARKRLDSHDEQNKALIALTEQVRGLSEDIKRIERKLDGGR
ncbi:DUF7365 family protein [Enterococcus cecorum]|uniref:DUF7365 family protein n=1 Tax=Enterococcus cecorum TaxID=44008 RepID=UPI0032C4671D